MPEASQRVEAGNGRTGGESLVSGIGRVNRVLCCEVIRDEAED
jgi:hypothetical protein